MYLALAAAPNSPAISQSVEWLGAAGGGVAAAGSVMASAALGTGAPAAPPQLGCVQEFHGAVLGWGVLEAGVNVSVPGVVERA
jgi:hypothetical protein